MSEGGVTYGRYRNLTHRNRRGVRYTGPAAGRLVDLEVGNFRVSLITDSIFS